MKRVVSRQASTLILPLGPDSSDHTTTRFLKAIKLQMSYAHHFRTLDCAGVQSLDYAVRVEVEPGVTTPFKNTTLRRELLSLRLPTKEDGTPGNTFIDGARAPRGDNCEFCIKTRTFMRTLSVLSQNHYAHTCISTFEKRGSIPGDAVLQFFRPGLMLRRDFLLSTPSGMQTPSQQRHSKAYLTRHTFKTWRS